MALETIKAIPFKAIIIFLVVFVIFFYVTTGEYPWKQKA